MTTEGTPLRGVISLSAAARLCNELFGLAPNPSTLFRWSTCGVLVGDRRVRLSAVRMGRRLFTTKAWLEQFRAELNCGPAIATEDLNRRAADATARLQSRLRTRPKSLPRRKPR
jgi:hypothetical protein